MKKHIATLSTILVLSFLYGLTVHAQNDFEHIVEFDKVVHDFGDIMIADGPQECKFTMKNVSASPVVIHRVLTSCGCTEPDWTKGPIKPGENGEIKVVFSNDQGPYPFNKSVTVYVSGLSKPVILKIKGVAHDKPKSLQELFPVACGPVGMREKSVSIGQIEQGLARSIEVEIANTSGKEIGVSFKDMTPGLTVSLPGGRIPARSKARITCLVDTEKTAGEKWGKTPFTFTIVTGGKEYGNAMVVEALIKENFSDLSETQKRSAALPQFEYSSVDLGVVGKGEEISGEFCFKNMGKQPFVIYKADSEDSNVEFSFGGSTAPGERGCVRFDSRAGDESGENMLILTLITNSPTRPIINLFVQYIVK